MPQTTLKFGTIQLPRRQVFQSVINSQCTVGYKPVHGDLKRVCQANGLWSGRFPVCEGKILSHYKANNNSTENKNLSKKSM